MFYSPNFSIRNFFVAYLSEANKLTGNINEAKYILLPFDYEIIYGYTHTELYEHQISFQQLYEMKQMAKELDELSVETNKKLIVFYYRDPEIELPFRNAIVFRTSWRRSKNSNFTFGMPAFVDERPSNKHFKPRPKTGKPSICFRGQTAPLKLPFAVEVKNLLNKIFEKNGMGFGFKIWYNEGYMVRRAAINSALKSKKYFVNDFLLNPVYTAERKDDLINGYLSSFLKNDYFICAAGHGNYSYRLYEVMREGRFPVFINTDCLLPCAELFDWKNLIIWVEKEEVDKLGEIVLDFHQTIHPDDFLDRQCRIQEFWANNLTKSGFAKYLTDNFFVIND